MMNHFLKSQCLSGCIFCKVKNNLKYFQLFHNVECRYARLVIGVKKLN